MNLFYSALSAECRSCRILVCSASFSLVRGYAFAKIRKKGTIYQERIAQDSDANCGIFIDLFPYDNLPNDKNKRRKLIQEYEIGAFETNLEIILASYKMAEAKKNNVNEILPQIRAMQAALSLKGNLTGIDVSNIMEFIADTTKSSLYFESLVPQEMRGMFKSLSALRSVASSVALSWHFANLPREVLMGF